MAPARTSVHRAKFAKNSARGWSARRASWAASKSVVLCDSRLVDIIRLAASLIAQILKTKNFLEGDSKIHAPHG